MSKWLELRAFQLGAIGAFATLALLLLALFTSSVRAQDQPTSPGSQPGQAPLLELGKPVENSLSGGEAFSYRIYAQEGQFLQVTIEQLGIHISLTLFGPDGKQLSSMENPNGRTGRQQISAIAKSNGTYTLELTSADRNAPSGRTRAVLQELHAPAAADRAYIAGEQAFMRAGELYREAAANSTTRAAQEYERALQLWRSSAQTYEESMTLNILGNLYLNVGERAKALDAFNQALPLTHALGDHPGEAAARENIGVVYYLDGQKSKALDQFTATLSFERETGEQRLQAESLSYLGEVYIDLGQEELALADFDQALTIVRQLGDQSAMASVLTNIGKVHDDLGEKQKALEDYAQALSLDRTQNDAAAESIVLSNVGMVYDALGDKKAALENYGQALKIERQLHASDAEARTLNNSAAVFDQLGQQRKALAFYNRAVSLWRRLKDSTGEAMALNNIGFAYHNRRQDQKALAYYNQALPVLRGADDRAGEAMVLHNIGVSEDRIGNPQEALIRLNESLLLFLEIQDPLNIGLTLGDLMAHSRDTGNPSAAIFFGKEAVNSYQQVRRNITGLAPNLQRSFVASKESTYRELADLLIIQGRLDEAEQVLDLLKQEEYFDFIRRDGKDSTSLTASLEFNPSENDFSRRFQESAVSITAVGIEWAALHAKLSRTTEENQLYDQLSKRLEQAGQDWTNFCSNLYDEMKGARAPLDSVGNINEVAMGMKKYLRDLGPGTAALYTLVGTQKYRIILVTPMVTLAREYPIGAADLRRKVLEFRQALRDTSKDPAPLAHELYEILVGPVASELDGARATTLMWSLDDVLRYLPVAALHDGHDYLVAKYRNEVFTPASMASLTHHPDVKSWSGVAMGISRAYGSFPPLPAVPEELRRIIRTSGKPDHEGVLPGQTMIDDTFTEANMEMALEKSYPLVHIASHFDFEPGDDTASFLLLGGPGAEGQQLSLAEIRKNPKFDFQDTELLTLSACNTAMGGTAGDGREIDGLGMLAQQKGARAVVASLWAVNDKSTGYLMQEFYRRWTTNPGLSKAEALRQAQLTMLHGTLGSETMPIERGVRLKNRAAPPINSPYSHPNYWAAFILIGNWQ